MVVAIINTPYASSSLGNRAGGNKLRPSSTTETMVVHKHAGLIIIIGHVRIHACGHACIQN